MILLYHLIFPDDTPPDAWNAAKILRLADFKRQIHWLKKYYRIIPLDRYVSEAFYSTKPHMRNTAITFDDGYHATFDLVAPFLEAESVPVTFFINTYHLENPRLLWFVFFNALCFEKTYDKLTIDGSSYPLDSEKNCLKAWRILINLARTSGNAITFSQQFSQRYPLPDAVTDKYMGLNKEQIRQISSSMLLSAGGHTHRHPYLDQVTPERQLDEITQNKTILEELTGKPVEYFAYTGGIYNTDSITAVKRAGFKAAFAIRPDNLGAEPNYEIPRTDIYSGSLIKFILKRFGAADAAQKIGIWG